MSQQTSDTKVLSRRRLMVFLAIVLALLAVFLYLAWRQRQFGRAWVTLGDDIRVAVEVADTDETRRQGLSGRDALTADSGMLFLFARPDRFGFWMKEMKFSIDIIWIRGSEIVDLTTDVPPPAPGGALQTYFPRYPIDRVLEVPAGFCREHGLRTGMTVKVEAGI